MDASVNLSLALACGYTYSNTQWFSFANTNNSRPIILLYDHHLNYKWGKAYDISSTSIQPTSSVNKCYFSMSNNLIVSSLFKDWSQGHDIIMINKVSDGSLVKAYIGSITAGTYEQGLSFATAQLKSDDQTLLIAFTQTNNTYIQVISLNISSGT